MKYNVGDRVRIKSLDWYNNNKDENDKVIISSLGPVFTRSHSKYAGRIMTIGIVSKLGFYVLKEDKEGNRWYDEMFEGLVEETKPKMVNLEKACEWLKENIWVYINYEGCSGEELENDVIEDFRKAMEE